MGDRLLIVEDDDRIRAMLRLGLEDEGYQVAEADSGESAVEQIRRDPPDMAIIDLMLGGMDGFTCIREVRRTTDLPIIVVSARSDTHDVVAGLEAGADRRATPLARPDRIRTSYSTPPVRNRWCCPPRRASYAAAIGRST